MNDEDFILSPLGDVATSDELFDGELSWCLIDWCAWLIPLEKRVRGENVAVLFVVLFVVV